jgi:hypothetical protein
VAQTNAAVTLATPRIVILFYEKISLEKKNCNANKEFLNFHFLNIIIFIFQVLSRSNLFNPTSKAFLKD